MATRPREFRAEKRDWTPREMRLVTEFCQDRWPAGGWATRVRLGSTEAALGLAGLPENYQRMVQGAFRRYADAVVFGRESLIIVEGKIVLQPVALAQLELYARLVPSTPEFFDWRRKAVELWLVYAVGDPLVEAMAREKGMRTVEFKPAWVDEYLALLDERHRGAPLVGL